MKSTNTSHRQEPTVVALFTRAWIEIQPEMEALDAVPVALFTRAWIEIRTSERIFICADVALFTRAWIEIRIVSAVSTFGTGRPLYEGVD